MSQSISLLTLAVTAAALLAAERVVDQDGNYATAAGNSFGVTRTDAEIGDRVAVDVIGTAVATAGGAFSEGDYLQVGANGKLVVQAAGIAVARALQDAAADGDRVEVLLIPNAPAGV